MNSAGEVGTGNGSLFSYNSNPNSAYLFTANSGFGSAGDLYDSSYFFSRVDPNHADTMTRLGDDMFDAMLAAKEVQAATGQAQLSDYGSALDQYRGLLDNAASQQQGLGLQLGVALTPEQVAGLTAPILWYVSEEVDGQNVLVPVLYMSASDAKTIGSGALVAGTNVLAEATGNITNSGTIDASQIVGLTSGGGDIVNKSGGVIAGGSVVANAATDIVLEGGSTIAANGDGSYSLPDGKGGTITVPGGVVSLSAGNNVTTRHCQEFRVRAGG